MSESENILANLFKYLGLAGALGGAALVVLGVVGLPVWNSGPSVQIDAMMAGILFTVMGVGFMTFGKMVEVESWEKAEN